MSDDEFVSFSSRPKSKKAKKLVLDLFDTGDSAPKTTNTTSKPIKKSQRVNLSLDDWNEQPSTDQTHNSGPTYGDTINFKQQSTDQMDDNEYIQPNPQIIPTESLPDTTSNDESQNQHSLTHTTTINESTTIHHIPDSNSMKNSDIVPSNAASVNTNGQTQDSDVEEMNTFLDNQITELLSKQQSSHVQNNNSSSTSTATTNTSKRARFNDSVISIDDSPSDLSVTEVIREVPRRGDDDDDNDNDLDIYRVEMFDLTNPPSGDVEVLSSDESSDDENSFIRVRHLDTYREQANQEDLKSRLMIWLQGNTTLSNQLYSTSSTKSTSQTNQHSSKNRSSHILHQNKHIFQTNRQAIQQQQQQSMIALNRHEYDLTASKSNQIEYNTAITSLVESFNQIQQSYSTGLILEKIFSPFLRNLYQVSSHYHLSLHNASNQQQIDMLACDTASLLHRFFFAIEELLEIQTQSGNSDIVHKLSHHEQQSQPTSTAISLISVSTLNAKLPLSVSLLLSLLHAPFAQLSTQISNNLDPNATLLKFITPSQISSLHEQPNLYHFLHDSFSYCSYRNVSTPILYPMDHYTSVVKRFAQIKYQIHSLPLEYNSIVPILSYIYSHIDIYWDITQQSHSLQNFWKHSSGQASSANQQQLPNIVTFDYFLNLIWPMLRPLISFYLTMVDAIGTGTISPLFIFTLSLAQWYHVVVTTSQQQRQQQLPHIHKHNNDSQTSHEPSSRSSSLSVLFGPLLLLLIDHVTINITQSFTFYDHPGVFSRHQQSHRQTLSQQLESIKKCAPVHDSMDDTQYTSSKNDTNTNSNDNTQQKDGLLDGTKTVAETSLQDIQVFSNQIENHTHLALNTQFSESCSDLNSELVSAATTQEISVQNAQSANGLVSTRLVRPVMDTESVIGQLSNTVTADDADWSHHRSPMSGLVSVYMQIMALYELFCSHIVIPMSKSLPKQSNHQKKPPPRNQSKHHHQSFDTSQHQTPILYDIYSFYSDMHNRIITSLQTLHKVIYCTFSWHLQHEIHLTHLFLSYPLQRQAHIQSLPVESFQPQKTKQSIILSVQMGDDLPPGLPSRFSAQNGHNDTILCLLHDQFTWSCVQRIIMITNYINKWRNVLQQHYHLSTAYITPSDIQHVNDITSQSIPSTIPQTRSDLQQYITNWTDLDAFYPIFHELFFHDITPQIRSHYETQLRRYNAMTGANQHSMTVDDFILLIRTFRQNEMHKNTQNTDDHHPTVSNKQTNAFISSSLYNNSSAALNQSKWTKATLEERLGIHQQHQNNQKLLSELALHSTHRVQHFDLLFSDDIIVLDQYRRQCFSSNQVLSSTRTANSIPAEGSLVSGSSSHQKQFETQIGLEILQDLQQDASYAIFGLPTNDSNSSSPIAIPTSSFYCLDSQFSTLVRRLCGSDALPTQFSMHSLAKCVLFQDVSQTLTLLVYSTVIFPFLRLLLTSVQRSMYSSPQDEAHALVYIRFLLSLILLSIPIEWQTRFSSQGMLSNISDVPISIHASPLPIVSLSSSSSSSLPPSSSLCIAFDHWECFPQFFQQLLQNSTIHSTMHHMTSLLSTNGIISPFRSTAMMPHTDILFPTNIVSQSLFHKLFMTCYDMINCFPTLVPDDLLSISTSSSSLSPSSLTAVTTLLNIFQKHSSHLLFQRHSSRQNDVVSNDKQQHTSILFQKRMFLEYCHVRWALLALVAPFDEMMVTHSDTIIDLFQSATSWTITALYTPETQQQSQLLRCQESIWNLLDNQIYGGNITKL